MTTIGSRIYNTRKARKLTQEELAKKIGKTQSSIAYLESDGPNVGSSSRLAAIARALNVNAHWLETGQGSPEPDYVQPVVVEKRYCKETEEAIALMESTDERGRLKMLIAVQDALEAHEARLASLPRPRIEEPKVDERAKNARSHDQKVISETEKITSLVEELMPDILGRVKTMENESGSSDACIDDKHLEGRKDKRH